MPDLKIDHQKSALENMISLVNFSNQGLSLTSEQINFGQPSPFSAEGVRQNTAVTVFPVAESGFKDPIEVKYIRLTLTQNVVDPIAAADVKVDYDATQSERLGAILSSLQLVSDQVDVYINDSPFDPVNNPIIIPAEVTIKIKEGSVLYQGEDATASISLIEKESIAEGNVFFASQMYDIDVVEVG